MSQPADPLPAAASDSGSPAADAVAFVAAVRSHFGVDSAPFASFLLILREFKGGGVNAIKAANEIRVAIVGPLELRTNFDRLINKFSESMFITLLSHAAVADDEAAAVSSGLPPLKFTGPVVNPLDPSEGPWNDASIPQRAAALPVVDETNGFEAVHEDWSFFLELMLESLTQYDEAYLDCIERSIEAHDVHEFWHKTYAITNIALCMHLPALLAVVQPMRDLGRRMRNYSRDPDIPCNFPGHEPRFPYPPEIADIMARLKLRQIRLMPALRAEMARYRALVPRIRLLDALQQQAAEMQAEGDEIAHVHLDARAVAS